MHVSSCLVHLFFVSSLLCFTVHCGAANTKKVNNLFSSSDNNNVEKSKKPKTSADSARLFSLFNIVVFQHDQCRGASGQLGTCISAADCIQGGKEQ